MIYLRLIVLFSFLGSGFSGLSQVNISGRVVASVNEKPLPYVNIGIKNKTLGTISQNNGYFTIQIPEEFINDTLTFSLVGFQKLELRIDTLDPKISQPIKLAEKTTELNEVVISAEKLVERKYGVKRRNLLIHFSDGMFQGSDVFEIGQLIKLKDARAQITSVSLYLFGSKRDSATFRINFYAYQDNRPSKRLLEKSIIQRHPIQEGWLKLDLTNENILLTGNFIVSLEFIPEINEKSEPIYYEVRLGGSSRSFYRRNSLGQWNTPPHHYCMYVTALVDKSTPEEPEEVETRPTLTLGSNFVKDSFNLFVRLPTGYDKNLRKRYPVVYCLDANAYFDHVAHFIQQASKKRELDVEPILVGIGYENAYIMDSLRVRDYTFPQALPSDSLPVSGGGEQFYKFLEIELLPYIDKKYRTDTANRSIMGHSFGGYFTCYAMLHGITKYPLFNNYIAASPSLWYHNNYLFDQFKLLASPDSGTIKLKLFLSMGESEVEYDLDNNFGYLSQLLLSQGEIQIQSTIYPGLEHMGTVVPSFEDGIQFLFGSSERE